jgi:D-alanyl-D-alanine carboxypeptidase
MKLPTRSGLVLGCAFAIGALSPAIAGPAIVIDVDSGRVLHQEDATQPWFPASVTKLMTAYVALRQVSAGRLSMETPLVVSQRAARMAPSKIGFKPGQLVTLDNALKIIMVKSANDVSVTIAEGVGGSVEGFADMMNREAQRLGMRDSHFVNPNGLPDAQQRTSARDMALLGRALLLEFPRHRDLWGIGAIQLGKRVMPNTNGLIGRYSGATGMKTGFICSSGFNVVAAAERGGQRLITVVMGSPSATERTIRASELFDRGFSGGGGWGGQLAQDLPSVGGEPPDKRPEICGRNRAIPSEEGVEFAAPVAATTNGNNPEREMFAMPAAAPAAQVQATTRRTLGPRAQFEPVVVYAGRAPGSTLAARGPGAAPATAASPAIAAAPAAAAPAVGSGLPAIQPATASAAARPGAIAAPAGARAFAPTQASLPGTPPAPSGQPLQLQGGVPLPAPRIAAPTPTQRPVAAPARASAGASLVTGGRAAPAATPGAIAPRTVRPASAQAVTPPSTPAARPVARPRSPEVKPPAKPKAAPAARSAPAATRPTAATPAQPRKPAAPVVEKPKYD